MRILSRPMFKYGGPIKEGIMHSMKNGGTAGVGHGLVGDQRYPKTGGREHHGFFLPALYSAGAAALRYLPNIYRGIKAGKYVKGWKPTSTFRRVPGRDPSAAYIKGDPSAFAGSPASRMGMWKALGDPKRLGAAIRENPGTALTLGSLGATGASRLFGSKPKNVKLLPQQEGPPGGGETSLGSGAAYYDKPPVTKSAAELAAEAKAARKAKIAKYMDTMGYDRAQKNALGKALVDASAIVQAGTEEGGSLKHADWGKMINQAIQTTSKRLEKPEQIREAVGLMMTKAGIEKDMTADADAIAKRKLNLQIKELEEKIDPSAADLALAYGDKTDKQVLLENIVKKVKGIENLKASFKDVKDTAYGDWKKKKENKNKSSLDFMEKIIKPSGGMTPGFYVFPTKIVEVTDDLTIKWYQ